jgi:hypothetical protein
VKQNVVRKLNQHQESNEQSLTYLYVIAEQKKHCRCAGGILELRQEIDDPCHFFGNPFS